MSDYSRAGTRNFRLTLNFRLKAEATRATVEATRARAEAPKVEATHSSVSRLS